MVGWGMSRVGAKTGRFSRRPRLTESLKQHGEGESAKSPRTEAGLPPPSRFSPTLCQSWEKSCAQTAIIPTNSVMDASAAASSTKTRNIAFSPRDRNIERTLFFFCSGVKGSEQLVRRKPRD